MKKQGYSGASLIQYSNAQRAANRQFDSWLSHASPGSYGYGWSACLSGSYIVFSNFTLHSDADFYYPFLFTPDESSAFAAVEAYYAFSNGIIYGPGEIWNFTLRASVFDKVSGPDWDAWTNAH